MIEILADNIYVCGDIHSDWDKWDEKVKYFNLRNCCFIHCGDGGEGFLPFDWWLDLNEICKERNIQFLNVRGNHSDPDLFRGENRIHYSHLEFLEDYSFKRINGLEFLFVGGAISTDRYKRKVGYGYWLDERFVLEIDKIKPCDVLITHSAPIWNGPISKVSIEGECKKDLTLWDDCCKERADITELIELCMCDRHFCGHFHEYYMSERDGCRSRILGKVEIIELK